jgi:hypothetical protein
VKTDEAIWLIWSNEHGKWWGPYSVGYVAIIAKAGRYTSAGADLILSAANYRPDVVNEVKVLAPEVTAELAETLTNAEALDSLATFNLAVRKHFGGA